MKTLYLEKWGSDFGDGTNADLWFRGFEKETHKMLEMEIYAYTAWRRDRNNRGIIYSTPDSYNAICFIPCVYDRADKLGFKKCHECKISKKGLDMLPSPFNQNIKYTFENILKVVNDLTGENFDKIELVDAKGLNK